MHDAKILALLQKDAARGLAALSAQYGGLMVSICRAVLPQHPQDAEEAAADTLVHLWRTAPALPLHGLRLGGVVRGIEKFGSRLRQPLRVEHNHSVSALVAEWLSALAGGRPVFHRAKSSK